MAQPTPTEQRALFAQAFKKRMGNLADVGDRVATDVPKIASGLAKEEIFGLPGLVGDLIVPAMSAKGPLALDPAVQEASEKFQEEYGASGLAKKAGVELSDEFMDAEGNLRPEMLGRLLAPGALYAKTAGLAGLFKQAVTKTKTRGSGIEKKGSGNAELDSSPSELGPTSSEQLADLSTPELLTSWTIEPGKVNRAEVAARIKGDPDATARSNQALDDLGYGDTVPMYRVIKLTDDGKMEPEELISATLDPSKVPTNLNFFTQGKVGLTTPTEFRVVRYDVPRDRVAGYLPAFSGDITEKVNKAVKNKGFGQEKVEGLQTVTDPAKHAKSLLDMQDEIIADVSGLQPRVLSRVEDNQQPLNMLSMERMLPNAIASGEIKTVDDFSTAMGFSNYTVLSPRNFMDNPEAFQAAERTARQKAIDEYSEFFNLKKAPEKDVLEGEVVGGKSDKYTKLQKQADEARTSELSDAKTLQMEIQGVTDAFDVAAAKKLDATFEMIGRQMGEDAPYTSKDFTDNVIDEFEGALDQGMSRADALIDAVRVTTDNYNRTFNADLFNTEDILSDLSKGINEDFGFDAALDARRAGQANRAALEQQLKKAEAVTRRADAAASQAELERLAGVTDDMTPDEVFQAISSYVGKDQAGISGAGIPQPKRPQLRVISDNTPVKKAAGGKVDLRSGIGNVFKLYS